MGDIFSIGFFLLVTAVSSFFATLCPLPGGVKRDRTCLDDSTQLRVMLPDSRPVVVMAPNMTSLHLWFPKGSELPAQPYLTSQLDQRLKAAPLCAEMKPISMKNFTSYLSTSKHSLKLFLYGW